MGKLKKISVILLSLLVTSIIYGQNAWVEIVNSCSRQPTLNVQLQSFTGSGCPNTLLSQPIISNSSHQFDDLNDQCQYWKLSYGPDYYVVPKNKTVIIGNGFTQAQGCICVSGCIAR